MKICGQGLPPQAMMIPQYSGLLYKPHYRLNHSYMFITVPQRPESQTLEHMYTAWCGSC